MGQNRELSRFPNAITVLDNGNVGIGTTNPSQLLEVNVTTQDNGIRITSSNSKPTLRFYSTASNASNRNWAISPNGQNFGDLQICTSAAQNGDPTASDRLTRLIITSSGNVGIGTNNPQSYTNYTILHVAGTATNGSGLLYLTNSNNSIVGLAYAEGTNSNVTFGSQTNHPVRFVSNDTERMRITSAGNIGIGESNPTYPASRSGMTMKAPTTAGTEFVMLSSTDTGFIGGCLVRNGTDFGMINRTNGSLIFATNAIERMYITSAGQVQRPNQPSFLATSTNSGFSAPTGSWGNIGVAITEESYDIGNNYSSGRFTAPVAGRYLFYAGGWAGINTNGERYGISATVNGGTFTFITGGNYCITDSPLASYTVVYNLAANDYVDLFAFSQSSGTWGFGTHRLFFGGYML
jgi:hypothetical protein